jgi:stearoyl-CoA desaturase (delta-9 desaturase)
MSVKSADFSEKRGRTSTSVRLLRWFDTAIGGDDGDADLYRIDWLRCLPFFAIHLMCLGVIWVGWSPVAVGTAVGLYALRAFALTAFYHRYFSHRAFKTSRCFQFLFALIGNSAVQRGPLWWAAHHRQHHAHADEPGDAHSPWQHGYLWSHLLWFTSRVNFRTNLALVPDLARYPELRLLDRFDVVVPVVMAAGLYALGRTLESIAPALRTSGWQMVIWGFFISNVALFHATGAINSLAHRFGSRRYPTRDHSRNNFWLALLTLGEGWHNNHHHFPNAARQGFFWWEIDVTYYVLILFSRIGLVWDLKTVPARVLHDRQRITDQHASACDAD